MKEISHSLWVKKIEVEEFSYLNVDRAKAGVIQASDPDLDK